MRFFKTSFFFLNATPILEILSFLSHQMDTQQKKSSALRQPPVRSVPSGRLKLLRQKDFLQPRN